MNRMFAAAVGVLASAAALAAQPADPPRSMFAAHRAAFMDRMEGGIAIFTAQPEIPRNDDAGYFYRQDSDFYYLTGFTEPGAVAVFRPGAPEGERYTLFVRPRDPLAEVWNGYRAGVGGAVRDYGAEQAWPADSAIGAVQGWLAEAGRVYFDDSADHPWAQVSWHDLLAAWVDEAADREVIDSADITHELRLVKSADEIALLQRAIDITADAHRAAMVAIRPGMYEYELEAMIEYVYRKQGSPRVGFNSIVGSGPNSTILHYEANDRRMEADDIVVVDIGAEWGYYTADVTRTLPVDGVFSAEQRAIYQIVLDAQQAGIDMVRPGMPYGEFHTRAVEIVTAGLVDLDILEGSVEENIESGTYRRFFMHGTGHWLGLDVHDVGGYGATDGQRLRPLEPGMVFTIEPGIYIAAGSEGVDPKWWNIGVRIEDDVLITEDGHRLMSAGAPRTIDAIEALIAGNGVPDVVPAIAASDR